MLRAAEWIDVVYFCVLGAAAFRFRLPPGRRGRILALGASGLLATLAGAAAPALGGHAWGAIVRDWMPAPVLLIAYWQAGQFYAGPSAALERRLERWDRAAAHRLAPLSGIADSRWFAAYFEAAYILAYPLVPLALAVLYAAGRSADAGDFWAVVLPAAYLCYAMLPLAPTRPPRLLAGGIDAAGTRGGGDRRLNLWILDRLGIGANTFPSGHVAATTAASLVVAERLPAAGAVFLWISASIAAAVVLRRYHYLADAVLGAALALAVWIAVRAAAG